VNPISRKSISELVSFRSLIGFGKVVNELQTFKKCKKCKEIYGYRGHLSPVTIHFFVNLEMFGKLLLVQYLTKPIETL